MTYADLREAHLAPLREAAQAWTDLSRACTKLEERCGTDLTGPLRTSGWQGSAASAALGRLDTLDDEFGVASLQTRTAASVLREAAEDFGDLQQRLESAVGAARSLGLTVDDTGRVSAPAMIPGQRPDPDAEPARRRQARDVAAYNDLIARIVTEATEADGRIARALSQLKAGPPGQFAREYDGALAAAGALGLGEDDIPAPGSDPADARAWWDGLSDDERQVYLAAYPERIGALDGLPATDRDAANQLALRTFVGEHVDDPDRQYTNALALLEKLEDARDAAPHERLYLLSFDPAGDGKAAVAIGNPDTADHTAVLVPGVGTELDGIRGLIGRADDLREASTELAPAGTDVSVVAWLGYDTPSFDLDIVSAVFGAKSEAGARALDGFVDGLRVAHDDSPSHVTAVGHSYGSTVLGEAASTGDGLAVDDMIAVGSPGMRVESASEFNIDPRHVWAGAAADDTVVARPEDTIGWLGDVPVVGDWLVDGVVGIHGPAPHDPEFGGNVLHVDTSGHSGYWAQNSQMLRSQAAVIVGDYEAAALDHGKAP
ncbi:alpha/beta hydrolase [Micromonospora sp. NPDC047074]|uniref:alpha/beta hydrolase n=1 Tax=Micromonospora sp. NPDC047074 TaxID=3154339 RepID=UPI0033D01F58